jgi:hypothetical protein
MESLSQAQRVYAIDREMSVNQAELERGESPNESPAETSCLPKKYSLQPGTKRVIVGQQNRQSTSKL